MILHRLPASLKVNRSAATWDDLLITGLTFTNVMGMHIVLVR
jgi:glycerate-2-kinase